MAIDQAKLRPTKIPGVYLMADGKFLVRVSVWLSGTSKQLKKVLDAQTRPDELKRAVLDLKAEARNPAPKLQIPTPRPSGTSQTLEDYGNQWVSVRSPRLKPSTAVTYRNSLHKHIFPKLGWMPCGDVTRGAVESWVVWAEQQEQVRERRVPVTGPDGKAVRLENGHVKMRTEVETVPYSHDTLRQWWRVLATVLKDMAADLDLTDPTARVRPPERPQLAPKREQRTVETDDLAPMLEAAREHAPDRYTEIAVLTLSGMRSGELYALKWDCVDLDKGELLIRRSVSDGILTETTKTKSQRTVPMHPLVVDLLKAHKAAQEARDKEKAKEDAPAEEKRKKREPGLVFPSKKGTPRTSNTLKKAFEAIKAATGIDIKVGPQVLRRSMNSNLVRQQVDRLTLRAIMGHTTEQMTARYYGVSADDKKAAVHMLPGKTPAVVAPDPDQDPHPAAPAPQE